ncbi:hypothetical protein SISNIDRAFT_485531 [Sistotremastrum niveocremeum HHB9708]|uniref:Uncharacterized protein n=2 Tax=Sistotremastraceae TaxID=3402574 RepID=A0A164UIA1_9AGAM|nr:hypothetical protein SISNIDRAFT_485531 [Sistotremastrum niveocremeum HHB9708]KZT43942.1 hypothetical protein SISSUDRAFT_1029648 [Sistotremastrum suecicum HHB10207 ss-3]
MSTSKRTAVDSLSFEQSQRPSKLPKTVHAPNAKPKAAFDPALLDLTTLTTDDQISERFSVLARTLLHTQVLRVHHNGTHVDYELLEVEFYLQNSSFHIDPFCHGVEEQKRSCNWYFHRVPRRSPGAASSGPDVPSPAGGYRGGTRKGLDITFGNPVSSQHFNHPASHTKGGILFRTIRRIQDGKVISGPSLLVDEILRAFSCHSIPDLVQNLWKDNVFALRENVGANQSYLSLAPMHARVKFPTIHTSPRVGLDLSHPSTTASVSDPRVIFMSRQYRYFMEPKSLNAGRLQTFTGVLHELLGANEDLGSAQLALQIAVVTGLAAPVIAKYLADYEAGLKSGDLAPYVGVKGKGVSSSPGSYMRLMGVLRKLGLWGSHSSSSLGI